MLEFDQCKVFYCQKYNLYQHVKYNSQVIETKKNYGWPLESKFHVPETVLEHMNFSKKGEILEKEWNQLFESYRSEFPQMAENFETAISDKIPEDFAEDITRFSVSEGSIATRVASGLVLNEIAKKIPYQKCLLSFLNVSRILQKLDKNNALVAFLYFEN